MAGRHKQGCCGLACYLVCGGAHGRWASTLFLCLGFMLLVYFVRPAFVAGVPLWVSCCASPSSLCSNYCVSSYSKAGTCTFRAQCAMLSLSHELGCCTALGDETSQTRYLHVSGPEHGHFSSSTLEPSALGEMLQCQAYACRLRSSALLSATPGSLALWS